MRLHFFISAVIANSKLDYSMKSVSRVCWRDVGEEKGRGRGEKGEAVHRLAKFSTLDLFVPKRGYVRSL